MRKKALLGCLLLPFVEVVGIEPTSKRGTSDAFYKFSCV